MDQAPFPKTMTVRCTSPGNAEKRPGQILIDTGIVHKRRTKAQKAADDQLLLEAKLAHEKVADEGIERLALIEMEAEAKENEAKAKQAAAPPPRPRPRIYKKKAETGSGEKEKLRERDSKVIIDSAYLHPHGAHLFRIEARPHTGAGGAR